MFARPRPRGPINQLPRPHQPHYDNSQCQRSSSGPLGVPAPRPRPRWSSFCGHAEQTAAVVAEPRVCFPEGERPDVVVVYDDVDCTIAAPLVSSELQVPLAQRRGRPPVPSTSTMPWEVNQLVTDRLFRPPAHDPQPPSASPAPRPQAMTTRASAWSATAHDRRHCSRTWTPTTSSGSGPPHDLTPRLRNQPTMSRAQQRRLAGRDIPAFSSAAGPLGRRRGRANRPGCHPRRHARLEAAGLHDHQPAYVFMNQLRYIEFMDVVRVRARWGPTQEGSRRGAQSSVGRPSRCARTPSARSDPSPRRRRVGHPRVAARSGRGSPSRRGPASGCRCWPTPPLLKDSSRGLRGSPSRRRGLPRGSG